METQIKHLSIRFFSSVIGACLECFPGFDIPCRSEWGDCNEWTDVYAHLNWLFASAIKIIDIAFQFNIIDKGKH